MLVCPSCRSENQEDAGVCRHCGTSLEAVGSPLRRLDRSTETGSESQLELWQPRSPSALPLIIGVLVVGLGLLGWGLFSTLKPNPCTGKYPSALFPYCADIPEGWVGGLRAVGDTYEDRFEPQELDGTAQATIRVSSLIDPTVGTPQYVQQYRTSQEATGRQLSEIDSVMLDGEQALAWTYTIPTEPPESSLRIREVILVRGEGAWRIQLVATDEAYENARLQFETLLVSWSWKA